MDKYEGHDAVDKLVDLAEKTNHHIPYESTRELHGLVDNWAQKYQQADTFPPIIGYFITTFFFVISLYLLIFQHHIYEEEPMMYAFFGIATFMAVLLYFYMPLFTLYVMLGGKEEIVYVVEVTESDVNSTTINGHTTYASKIVLRTAFGEEFYYELGRKKPARDFQKGDEIPIKVRGKFYKPIERMYR